MSRRTFAVVVPPSANATPFDTNVLRDEGDDAFDDDVNDDDDDDEGLETTVGSATVGDDVIRWAIARDGGDLAVDGA